MYERRPGVWELRKQCGRRADGTPRIVRETVHGDEDRARAELYALSERMGTVPAEADGMTLGTFFTAYYVPGLVRQGRAVVTVSGYESTWRCHLAGRWGRVPLNAIRDADARSWAWSIDNPNVARKAYKLLRQVTKAAFDYGLTEEPALRRRCPLPAATHGEKVVWSGAEVAEALRRLSEADSVLLPVFCLMAGGGMRREEAVAVRGGEVRWEGTLTMDGRDALTAFVRVDKAYTARDGLKGTKNPQSVRTVAVGEPFSSAMRPLLPDGPLLVARDGSLRNPDEVGRAWTRLFDVGGALHGMRPCKLMNLRHAHATLMLASGVDPETTAKAHGHSAEVEYTHYLRPSDETMARAAGMVAVEIGRDA
jgi:integrase